MSSSITIPLSRLSLDTQRRHAQLRDYFCDKDALATQVGDQWTLALEWSRDPYRYVDPRLGEGLAWWGDDLQYEDIAVARKRKGRVLLSMNDTWTLESWSEWLVRRSCNADIVVLHVDDHKDLGAPRIFQCPEGWIDPIEGRTVNLREPNTVTSAIMSGALGMGSFLTPFLHYVPATDVRHLCQGPKCNGTVDSFIKRESAPDSLLDPDALRPAVALVPGGSGVGRGRYRFTNDLDAWLEGLDGDANRGGGSDAAILLHIDMDYFCNRYDGDSDAIERPGPLNPSLPEILDQISTFTQALRHRGLLDRLDDIVIAFSPGFFPAEFWAESCERLLSGLGESPWLDP
ncbi:hypothetical protein JE010_01895 [Pseudomonas aeruginosa]|uniref:hypothetical protein n=1 Tax=Pseudomonas aeruginosa TaxID=287 RepID=UPI0004F23EBA|nr:hypothetical protein [Pseudomonas aeruginosa]MBI8966158.1 hypothetical protein [Pseudomonas aeruginosa]WCY21775.1 hypothetical protein KK186_19685 [Pseudomonas aeruginosa]HBO5727299.1 hypothetical protein [Pseudomonas aeruginosa]